MINISGINSAQQNNKSSLTFGALKFANQNALTKVQELMTEFIPKNQHVKYLSELCRIDAQTTKLGTDFIVIPTFPSGSLMGKVVDSQNIVQGEHFAVSTADSFNKTVADVSKQIQKTRIGITGKQEPKIRVTSKDILDRMIKGIDGFEVLDKKLDR